MLWLISGICPALLVQAHWFEHDQGVTDDSPPHPVSRQRQQLRHPLHVRRQRRRATRWWRVEPQDSIVLWNIKTSRGGHVQHEVEAQGVYDEPQRLVEVRCTTAAVMYSLGCLLAHQLTRLMVCR